MRSRSPEKPFFSWMGWGMLRACPRRWFLYNFGRDLPGETGSRYLAERKLSYWQAFAGQLADDGVTEAIRHFKKHKVWRQDLDAWLHERAFEYVKESREYTFACNTGQPLPRVKRQVLDRYFFGPLPDKDEHKMVLETARQAVRNFYQTDIPGRIEAAPTDALMSDHKDGEFPWSDQNGVPVYAVYDFAIRLPDRVTIFDWKTGKVNPKKEEDALEQLHWYALYAMAVWHIEPENIRLAPVFLSASTRYHETAPAPERLERIQSEWQAMHAEVKDKMRVATGLEALQHGFAMTDNLRECAGCVFRSCPGYGRIEQVESLNPVKFAILGENE